jgi:ADP-L-glycero-D-manno-heptose 6-epimerase
MIIVTGANGFIGSAFVWELNLHGREDIICVDPVSLRDRPELLRGRRFIEYLSPEGLLDYLQSPEAKRRVTAIVHMGACSDTTQMDRDFLRRNNTEYTQKLFTWATEAGKPFLYASSGATYGLGQEGFSDEGDPRNLRPLNPYGESKAAFDRWVVTQTRVPPVWFGVRFFNVYGPNENFKGHMASVVYKAFQQISATGELKLFRSENPDYQDGKQMRDFVYIKDVTAWMWRLLHHSNGSGLYNMGYGQARTWLDLARAVFQQMGRPVKINWIDMPAEVRDQYQYFTEAKMDKLFALGLNRPEWNLESGVGDYLQNYLLATESFL